MHLKRWITAIIAMPFLIALIYSGGPRLFAVFIGVVSATALWEYYRVVFSSRPETIFSLIPALGFVLTPLIMWAAYSGSFDILSLLIALNIIISGMLSLFQYKTNPAVIDVATKQALGLIYLPFFLSYFVAIRNSADGAAWIFFILLIVFSNDTGAFYVGSYLGRHKLCPSVSPGKTIEGAIGGIATSMAVGALFKLLFLPQLPWGLTIVFCFTVGATGSIGDLFESVLKRTGNIKDSGKLLPGHGGILDRIDALVFTAPVAYMFKEYFF